MTKLLLSALIAATLGSTAQAAPSPDQVWLDRMSFAVNDALSQSDEAPAKAGVVYVPVTVDAQGRAQATAPAQSCGCPDLDQAAVDALSAMRAPRPPADLAGKRILVRVEFKGEPTHGDLSRLLSRCN